MDSQNVQEQSTLVILPLKSEYGQIKSAVLEEKTDEPITTSTGVTISVIECDDSALEGDTLVEGETTTPISDPESNFNGKGT